MKNKKGISLIVLIITIIVIIILSAVVILTLSKNNSIESAKEASFKEDVRTFQDELALAVSKEYANAGGQRDEKINTSNFNEIQDYIPSFSEKYKGKFEIKEDQLKYTNVTSKEEKWCKDLNLKDERNYRELEYIESTGEQWIDTEITPTLNTGLYLDFILLSNIGTSDYGQILGSSYVNNGRWGGIVLSSYGSTDGGQMSYGKSDLNFYNPKLKSNERMWLEIKNNTYTASTGTNIVFNNYSNLENNLYDSLYLFKIHYESDGKNKSKMKVYNFKMYDGDKVIIDCIPVLDKNNKPALYDKVNQKFYYNKGNGEDFKYKLK